jgi:hypothetical protein
MYRRKKNINLHPHEDDDTKCAPIGMGSQYKALAIVLYAYGTPIRFN